MDAVHFITNKMFMDIVLPRNNEEEFIEIASRLGLKGLYFLYNFNEYDENIIQKKLGSISNKKNLDLETGFLVNHKNINKAIQKSRLLVAKSSGDDMFFIESKKIKMIYGFEELDRKDYMHQRASGLNHVMCELARKNNVAIGFSYSSLLNRNGQLASLIMGRMMQNIKLCEKYKVKTAIGSFSSNPFDLRAPHDVMSLFAMMGMIRKG